MANGYQEQLDTEQRRTHTESIQFNLIETQKLVEEVKELKKGIRTIREELRRLDKLRPLREEDQLEGEKVDVVNDVDVTYVA